MCDIAIPHRRETFVTLRVMSFAGVVAGEGGGIPSRFSRFSGSELSWLKKVITWENLR